jgi:hypothetical protein
MTLAKNVMKHTWPTSLGPQAEARAIPRFELADYAIANPFTSPAQR